VRVRNAQRQQIAPLEFPNPLAIAADFAKIFGSFPQEALRLYAPGDKGNSRFLPRANPTRFECRKKIFPQGVDIAKLLRQDKKSECKTS
jgi:hypothetical protein